MRHNAGQTQLDPHHEAGTFKVWPTRSRLGFKLGFAVSNASSFTPYRRAMEEGVSPACTLCVRVNYAGSEVVRPAPSGGGRLTETLFCGRRGSGGNPTGGFVAVPCAAA